jgi:bla regulator protein blaR1
MKLPTNHSEVPVKRDSRQLAPSVAPGEGNLPITRLFRKEISPSVVRLCESYRLRDVFDDNPYGDWWERMWQSTAKPLALLVTLLYIVVPTMDARAQSESGGTTATLPKFAVASIHPLEPSEGPRELHSTFTPDGLLDTGVPLKALIWVAFGVSEDQILRLPEWARGRNYYIAAKVDAADVPQFSKLTDREKWAMVVTLLEERFGLKFHHEMKELLSYMLVIAKDGPKLKKSSPEELAEAAAPLQLNQPPPPPIQKVSGSKDGLLVEQTAASMANIATLVSKIVRSPVIDKTGLTGRYDLKLDYTPDVAELEATPGTQQAPNIFTALQEQLGLKLESGKGSVDVIVIDDIKQPSPN